MYTLGMQPEQVSGMVQYFLQGLESEAKTTARVVSAVPDDKGDYRPHPNSRSAKELAWHIVFTDVWFLDGIHKGAFNFEGEPIPADIQTSADMVKWYETNVSEGIAKIRGMSADTLSETTDFFGMFKLPRGLYLGFLNNHMIHHRGQLSAYLRPMGAKVPSIYGPSGDEGMG